MSQPASPILRIAQADVERAARNAEKFRKMVERGKTPEEIFHDLLKLVHLRTPAD